MKETVVVSWSLLGIKSTREECGVEGKCSYWKNYWPQALCLKRSLEDDYRSISLEDRFVKQFKINPDFIVCGRK